MKIGFLSICTMLMLLYSADSSAHIIEGSSRTVKSPLKPITNKISDENQSPKYVIESKNLWDGRSFADVVKGKKKSDTPTEKKEPKQEKKQKKLQFKLLQPKMNFEQNEYDARRSQQYETSGFGKKYQSSKNGNNKRRLSAHKGNLYNAR